MQDVWQLLEVDQERGKHEYDVWGFPEEVQVIQNQIRSSGMDTDD